MSALSVNIPQFATKQLKLQACATGKKLVVSTNWLPLFGFEANAQVRESLIGKNKGIKISLVEKSDSQKSKKVYIREYKHRRNNPLETLLDIRSQTLINEAFPEDTEMVHLVFSYGEITITPISNRQSEAIKNFKQDKKLSTFLACSSGVDAVSLKRKGFSIETLLEYRPHEKRDKNGLTETGALNALANIEVRHLINEDIMNLDIQKIARLTQGSRYSLFHISTQCDDFSNIKAQSIKDASLEDGSTTIDMFLDALNLIQQFNFPTILHENVKGFDTSDAGKIFKARLTRLGYKVYAGIYDARDYSGITGRVRSYIFATMLPSEFNEPKPFTIKNTVPLWERYIEPLIEKGELRDVTDCQSTIDGFKTGRARVITRDSLCSPTFLKSQNRQAKDSVFIKDDVRNRIYFPSNELMKTLMGIEAVNFEAVSGTVEGEIIGQSIEVPLHEALLESICEHISLANMAIKTKIVLGRGIKCKNWALV